MCIRDSYYPLEYGLDGMIKLCEEKIPQVAGKADGDGILGTKRLYFYEAAGIVPVSYTHLRYFC